MPNNMPPAEVVIDTPLVRGLLLEQFPELASQPLKALANGWDNTLVRLGDDLLLRLPRRESAAQLVAHEQQWLPRLAPLLPLAVPVPLHLGRPGPTYPWPWSITRYLPGTTPTGAGDFAQIADGLGHFLGRLHTAAPSDAPLNAFRGIPLAAREASFRANLALVAEAIDLSAVEAVWAAALSAEPWQHAPTWLHGDLHPANLLVDDGRIVAVLDFGDLTSGDPATDLAVAWMLLPPANRDLFWDSYAEHAPHAVDAALVARSRGWALTLGVVFLAHSADNAVMREIGLRTVHSALAES